MSRRQTNGRSARELGPQATISNDWASLRSIRSGNLVGFPQRSTKAAIRELGLGRCWTRRRSPGDRGRHVLCGLAAKNSSWSRRVKSSNRFVGSALSSRNIATTWQVQVRFAPLAGLLSNPEFRELVNELLSAKRTRCQN